MLALRAVLAAAVLSALWSARPAHATISAACAAPARALLSNSSVAIAETIRGSEPCPGGWTVTYAAGVYVGPRHCGVAWPSGSDLTLVASGGSVTLDCGGLPVLWTYDYADDAPRLFALAAEPGAGWLLAQAASFIRITLSRPTALLVRVASVRFQCLLYPGPAALVVRTPSGLRLPAAVVEITNCSFEYGLGFGVAVMGSANVSSVATTYAALSRGALFCVTDAAATPHSFAALDGPGAADAAVSCLNCALSHDGTERACTMPSAPPPPPPPLFYDVCHVATPPPPPTLRPPPPPSTPATAESGLVLLVVVSSAVIGAGLVALLAAAVWRARAGKAVAASLSTDPQAPSPQDFL